MVCHGRAAGEVVSSKQINHFIIIQVKLNDNCIKFNRHRSLFQLVMVRPHPRMARQHHPRLIVRQHLHLRIVLHQVQVIMRRLRQLHPRILTQLQHLPIPTALHLVPIMVRLLLHHLLRRMAHHPEEAALTPTAPGVAADGVAVSPLNSRRAIKILAATRWTTAIGPTPHNWSTPLTSSLTICQTGRIASWRTRRALLTYHHKNLNFYTLWIKQNHPSCRMCVYITI